MPKHIGAKLPVQDQLKPVLKKKLTISSFDSSLAKPKRSTTRSAKQRLSPNQVKI